MDPWAGPENISSITRRLSATLCAAPRQPHSSGFDIFVHLVSAQVSLLACFERILKTRSGSQWLRNLHSCSWALSELLLVLTSLGDDMSVPETKAVMH